MLRNCPLDLHSDLSGIEILALRIRILHLKKRLPVYELSRGSLLLTALEAQSKTGGELEPNGTLAC